MELWNEYEGLVIDGAFPLKKLLLPEGRSAFFSTSNSKGEPTVIRLIASHFDEEEILARWRGVKALGHPNILKLEQFGQLELDDTTVVYAVMEPVDANLAEVIADQRLSVPEIHQLATSVASALDVLHTNGFVHEHVEPANIYAVGETVKLRGECIRETPEGDAGIEARQHDIHSLGIVLLQAFGQKPPFEAVAPRPPLPAPFDQIVPNAIRGTWSLVDILAAIGPEPTPKPTSATAPNDFSAAFQTAASAQPKLSNENSHEATRSVESPNQLFDGSSEYPPEDSSRDSYESEYPVAGSSKMARNLRIGLALAVLLIVWLIWHSIHFPAQHPKLTPITPQTVPSAAANPKPSPAKSPNPQNTPSVASITQSGSQTRSHELWRVVAFTYNLRDQAKKKAADIAREHRNLHAEVFTPTGHAPYYVTVGGPMDHDAAFALARKAAKFGLPKDTYAQNYGTKQR